MLGESIKMTMFYFLNSATHVPGNRIVLTNLFISR